MAILPLDEVLHLGGAVQGSASDDAFDFIVGLFFDVFGSCCCFWKMAVMTRKRMGLWRVVIND